MLDWMIFLGGKPRVEWIIMGNVAFAFQQLPAPDFALCRISEPVMAFSDLKLSCMWTSGWAPLSMAFRNWRYNGAWNGAWNRVPSPQNGRFWFRWFDRLSWLRFLFISCMCVLCIQLCIPCTIYWFPRKLLRCFVHIESRANGIKFKMLQTPCEIFSPPTTSLVLRTCLWKHVTNIYNKPNRPNYRSRPYN